MNTPTLSQLADIGAAAAAQRIHSCREYVSVNPALGSYAIDAKGREAFAKAVLDAVGYKFPVDHEREAFDAWLKEQVGTDFMDMKGSMFLSWKAGREELRKAQALAKEPDTKTEPAWIEWKGGKCPIPDTVKRWEYRLRDGYQCSDPGCPPSAYDWEGKVALCQVVAYRVLDWGTTKQPE